MRTSAQNLRCGLGRCSVPCRAVLCHAVPRCLSGFQLCCRDATLSYDPSSKGNKVTCCGGQTELVGNLKQGCFWGYTHTCSWTGSVWVHMLADHCNSSADIVYISVNCRQDITSRYNKNVSRESGKIFLLLSHYCQPKANERWEQKPDLLYPCPMLDLPWLLSNFFFSSCCGWICWFRSIFSSIAEQAEANRLHWSILFEL